MPLDKWDVKKGSRSAHCACTSLHRGNFFQWHRKGLRVNDAVPRQEDGTIKGGRRVDAATSNAKRSSKKSAVLHTIQML